MYLKNENTMKKTTLLLAYVLLMAVPAVAGEWTRWVNPFVGTSKQDGLQGNTYPGPTLPFGMVQLSPDTREAPSWDSGSGYIYDDTKIYGFSHTRLSGTGANDLIDITLMPMTSAQPFPDSKLLHVFPINRSTLKITFIHLPRI